MAYTLEQLAGDIRSALKSDPGTKGRLQVCQHVSRALEDQQFVRAHLMKERPADAGPREILYQDPELGFCICGHVYPDKAHGKPHDHGSSWAVYGQATGVTEMTEWRIVEKGEGDRPTLVVPVETYELRPGEARLYDVGVVHSPKRDETVRLIRIEGKNLDSEKRSNIKAK